MPPIDGTTTVTLDRIVVRDTNSTAFFVGISYPLGTVPVANIVISNSIFENLSRSGGLTHLGTFTYFSGISNVGNIYRNNVC